MKGPIGGFYPIKYLIPPYHNFSSRGRKFGEDAAIFVREPLSASTVKHLSRSSSTVTALASPLSPAFFLGPFLVRFFDSEMTISRLLQRSGGEDNKSATMSGETLFERCAVENDGDQALMLQCISNGFEERNVSSSADLDQWLLVIAGGFVFFMQVCSCSLGLLSARTTSSSCLPCHDGGGISPFVC